MNNVDKLFDGFNNDVKQMDLIFEEREILPTEQRQPRKMQLNNNIGELSQRRKSK